MPDAVERDQKVRMICKYNLEGETLYTLKWYKSGYEFFRYTPKETPSTKFFPMEQYPHLEIIKNESYSSQVTLRRALLSIAGVYTCEVTTDIPSFHALSGQGELRIVVLPKEIPTLKYKPKVKEGEWAKVTCFSDKSVPAANLTWTINNNKVQLSNEKEINVSRRVVDENDLEQSTSQLSFLVSPKLLNNQYNIKVRCTATIYTVHQRTAEINLLLDKPTKFASIYTPEKQSYPHLISISTNIKSSRSNVENADSVIEVENLANCNTNDRGKISATIYIVPVVTFMCRKLCCHFADI